MLGANFLIRQSFHGPSVELIKHLELLRIIIIFVEKLGCLDASFEH